MGISVLRSWEDVNAPVLTRVVGSFLDVLEAVLVDGYGDKEGLGWEFVWRNTTTLVLRNQGTRMFVRFDNTVSYLLKIQAYESMSDIDTGLFVCPDPTLEASGKPFQAYFAYSSVSTATVNPWMILGDSKGIWLGFNGAVGQYGADSVYSCIWKFMYLGDYISYDVTNVNYNFTMCQDYMASNYWHGQWYFSSNITTPKQYYHAMRNSAEVPGAITLGLTSGYQWATLSLGSVVVISLPEDDYQRTSIPELHESGKLVGRLPGLKNSLSKEGYNGLSLMTKALNDEKKPEMHFDYGDYLEHFYRISGTASVLYAAYFVLTEGKGFRDVI